MNPRSLDPEAVRRRLVEIDRLLRWLGELGTPDGDTLRRDWRTRLLVERILEQLVEMAVGVNLHVTAALGLAGGDGYRDSFDAAAEAGVIGVDLAAALAPSASMRNVLVHNYLDVDLSIISAAIPLAHENYAGYRRAVALWLERSGG